MERFGVWKKDFEPIVLKAVVLASSISQSELQRGVAVEINREVSRPTINLCINRGYIPKTMNGFKAAVEKIIGQNPKAQAWLAGQGLRSADVWKPLGRELRLAVPADQGKRISKGWKRPALVPGDSEQIIQKEVEMISQEAMKHFKIFRNPFNDDIQKEADIYMSDEHRFIEAAMLDAAKHGGFLAVIGEVGSGKTVMRRKVIEQLKRDGDILVIYPQTIDKTRLTAGSICDAVVLDISSEKPKLTHEAKTRQVQRLLVDRAKSGYRAVLIIEEAHDLSIPTLKFLKRFHELEDGYRKLLGIILVGQTELKNTFDEGQNVDMREVIRRVQVAEIRGLNGNLRDYLEVKFRRIGRPAAEVFNDDAYEALSRRLTSVSSNGKDKVSHAYPLTVNNYIARALNEACGMGEQKVTAEVIEAI